MSKVFIFLSGAVVGSLITLYVSKRVFETAAQKRADEEIESVKVAFKKLEEDDKRQKELKENADNAISEYTNSDAQNESSSNKKADDEPFIIKPEDYGEEKDYEIISLQYFSKNTKLAYLSGGVVEYPEDLFDVEFLNRFGEYEPDMLYIRDPKKKIDYDVEYLNERYDK